MDTKKIHQPLTKFIDRLKENRLKINQVIVFGSYSAGTAHPDSDLDVLVISDDFKKFNEDQRFGLLYQARPLTEPIIHPWGFTSAELASASPLTTLGHARQSGIRFI